MSTIERQRDPPIVPDYDMLRCIGRGPDGETWLGRSVLGKLRAVKVVYRDAFESDEPYLRQFVGIPANKVRVVPDQGDKPGIAFGLSNWRYRQDFHDLNAFTREYCEMRVVQEQLGRSFL